MEIYHAKFGHSGMKKKEVTVLVIFLGGEVGQGVNRVKGGNSGGLIRVNHA